MGDQGVHSEEERAVTLRPERVHIFLKARPTTRGWGVFSQGDNVVQDSSSHGTRDTPVLVESGPQAVF